MSIENRKVFRHNCKHCIFLFHSTCTNGVATRGFDVYLCLGDHHRQECEKKGNIVIFRHACRPAAQDIHKFCMETFEANCAMMCLQRELNEFRNSLSPEQLYQLRDKVSALSNPVEENKGV